MGNQIKVTYIPKEFLKDPEGPQYKTQAYVDSDTLIGTNKHSGYELALAWSDEHYSYIQIDDYEHIWDKEGTPTRIDVTENYQEPEPFTRVQPKKQSRKKRRKTDERKHDGKSG